MNRLLFSVLILLPSFCLGQNYGICMQVIGSTGGSAEQGNYQASWTVGEISITTLVGVDRILTQGFLQPDVCAPVSTWNLDLQALAIEVFPNPTSSYLTVRFMEQETSGLRICAFDVLGKMVQSPKDLDDPSGTILDCTSWAPGIYFLQVTDKFSQSSALLRVVRL
jgi:hypothetical protein